HPGGGDHGQFRAPQPQPGPSRGGPGPRADPHPLARGAAARLHLPLARTTIRWLISSGPRKSALTARRWRRSARSFWGAALGHLGEPEAEHVELRVDRLLGGQLFVGVAPLGDQPAADLGGTDADEEPLGLELRVGLALVIDDVPDVVE